MTPNKNRTAVVLILWGLFILGAFGWGTVGRRLRTEVDGVVVASKDFPAKGAPRYATEYVVRGPDGDRAYTAGPTDGSLERSMPVGTRIVKKRWRLDYEKDGRTIGFPIVFYVLTLAIGLGAVAWGIALALSRGKRAAAR